MDNLLSFLTYLAAVSAASERITEIIKQYVSARTTPPSYTWPLVAGGLGVVLSFVAPPTVTPFATNAYVTAGVIGFATAGGAGFWNSILDALLAFAKTKESQVVK